MASLLGCGVTPSIKDTPAPVAKVTTSTSAPDVLKEWVVIKTWSGDGTKDTEKFEVTENTRVNWETSDANGRTQIYIRDKNGEPVNATIIIPKGVQKGVSNLKLTPGQYSLEIATAANSHWNITVEQQK
jgi:hypothetical protein